MKLLRVPRHPICAHPDAVACGWGRDSSNQADSIDQLDTSDKTRIMTKQQQPGDDEGKRRRHRPGLADRVRQVSPDGPDLVPDRTRIISQPARRPPPNWADCP